MCSLYKPKKMLLVNLMINCLVLTWISSSFAAEDRNLEECGGTSPSTRNTLSNFEAEDFKTLTKRALSVQVAVTSVSDCNLSINMECSGALLTRRHVLTAADCFRSRFDQIENRIYVARIGSTDFKQSQSYSIQSIKVHENYKAGSKYYNIALLTLVREVEDPKVGVICLPDAQLAERNLTGLGATATGWSNRKTDPSGIYNFVVSNMRITSNKECHRLYGETEESPKWFPKGVTFSLVCAYYLEGEKEICDGTVGSPLMILEKGRWYAVGLALLGGGCGQKEFPNSYTRVSVYGNWIRNSIQTCA